MNQKERTEASSSAIDKLPKHLEGLAQHYLEDERTLTANLTDEGAKNVLKTTGEALLAEANEAFKFLTPILIIFEYVIDEENPPATYTRHLQQEVEISVLSAEGKRRIAKSGKDRFRLLTTSEEETQILKDVLEIFTQMEVTDPVEKAIKYGRRRISRRNWAEQLYMRILRDNESFLPGREDQTFEEVEKELQDRASIDHLPSQEILNQFVARIPPGIIQSVFGEARDALDQARLPLAIAYFSMRKLKLPKKERDKWEIKYQEDLAKAGESAYTIGKIKDLEGKALTDLEVEQRVRAKWVSFIQSTEFIMLLCLFNNIDYSEEITITQEEADKFMDGQVHFTKDLQEEVGVTEKPLPGGLRAKLLNPNENDNPAFNSNA